MNSKRDSVPLFARLSAVASVLLIPLAHCLNGAVIVQSVPFEDLNMGLEYFPGDEPEPGSGVGVGAPLVGFMKFDSSLGTLNEIIVRSQIVLSVDMGLSYEMDEEADFGIDVIMPSGAEGGVFYTTDGGLYNHAMLSLDISFSDFATGVSAGPHAYSVISPIADEVLEGPNMLSLSWYDPADFIGVGNVSALSVEIILPFRADALDIEGPVSNLVVSANAMLAGNQVILEYHYTPVPEPGATAVLLGMGAICGCVWHRRRVGCPAHVSRPS